MIETEELLLDTPVKVLNWIDNYYDYLAIDTDNFNDILVERRQINVLIRNNLRIEPENPLWGYLIIYNKRKYENFIVSLGKTNRVIRYFLRRELNNIKSIILSGKPKNPVKKGDILGIFNSSSRKRISKDGRARKSSI